MKTKFTFAMLAAAASFSLAAPSAHAADCGTADSVKVAEMTWISAGALAHIAQKIMANGYDCNAQVIPGDTVPTATSMMTRGTPDVAPELWVSTAQTIWDESLAKDIAYKASDIFASGGEEGWWVPDYVLADHPEIKSVLDLKDNWQVFAEAANPNKGRLYGCPPGWGCEIITNNLFEALGLGETFELFSPGSGENLKASIARAVAQKEPFVGYYWSPADVIAKYKLVRLDMPAFEADKFKCLTDSNCANPEVTGWAVGEVAVAVVTSLKERAPDVVAFLGKMQISNDDVSAMAAWGDENSATNEEVANHFLKNYDAVWSSWVHADVADKVRAGL